MIFQIIAQNTDRAENIFCLFDEMFARPGMMKLFEMSAQLIWINIWEL